MKIPSAAKRGLGIAGVVALLAGCSGGTQSALTPSSGGAPNVRHVSAQALHGVSPSAVKREIRTTKSKGASWSKVRPNANNSLLYVTNTGNGTVTFYSYANGQGSLALQGTLTGFIYPGQPCSDKNGNVFIPDYSAGETFEYAHGGTTPIQTLFVGGTGCSVDKSTGNLAIAMFGSGEVAVFANATGSPSYYTWYTTPYPEYVAYDNHSNLFIMGNVNGVGGMGELPSGGSSVEDLTLSGFSVNFPGQIQWGGTYLLVGSQGNGSPSEPSFIEQTTVSGTTVTGHNMRTFPGSTDITGYWKTGSVAHNNAHVAAADYANSNVTVNTWPALSNVGTITNGVSAPFGTTVSR